MNPPHFPPQDNLPSDRVLDILLVAEASKDKLSQEWLSLLQIRYECHRCRAAHMATTPLGFHHQTFAEVAVSVPPPSASLQRLLNILDGSRWPDPALPDARSGDRLLYHRSYFCQCGRIHIAGSERHAQHFDRIDQFC